MRVWTAHTGPRGAPLLVREGFSWTALLFGPLWLLAHRVWDTALLAAALSLALWLLPWPWGAILNAALMVAIGVFGRDLCRWTLDRRGYLLTDIVAAHDEDAALARLLERRPDLMRAAFTEAMR